MSRIKIQCNAPRSKTDSTTQCPHTARSGSPYCGIHRNSTTRYKHPVPIPSTTTTHSQRPQPENNNTDEVAELEHPPKDNISASAKAAIRRRAQHQRIRTISNNNDRPPRKRTKTRQTPSPTQLYHKQTDKTATPCELGTILGLSNLELPRYAVVPPLLSAGEILTPEFAARPGVTNRYLDNLLAADPGLATRSITGLALDKYRYLLHPIGIFNPNDRLLRFIQRIRYLAALPAAQTACRLIQRTWRRKRYRSIAYHHGPAWFQPMALCSNNSDFYTCQDLDEIPPRLLFTYCVPATTTIYGFHLHSFLELVNNATTKEDRRHKRYPTVLNPFDRSQIPSQVIARAQHYDMIIRHWCAIDGLPYHNEIVAAKQADLDSLSPAKRAEMRIVDIFQKIDLLGYHTDVKWLAGKSVEDLSTFIGAININWTYRLGLSDSVRRDILPPPWSRMVTDLTSASVIEEISLALTSFGPSVFTNSNRLPGNNNRMTSRAQQTNNMGGDVATSVLSGQNREHILLIREEIKYKLLNRILDCLDAMMTHAATEDARNTAAVIILYSLAYINPHEVAECNPWMD